VAGHELSQSRTLDQRLYSLCRQVERLLRLCLAHQRSMKLDLKYLG